ncbi:MAG: pro-sigmaK processing inhibitor BofA family protein [Ruminococcus sp.]|nr:pro-sigmaK processing inhibitor BofA family protein [Ruminococcus sp.]
METDIIFAGVCAAAVLIMLLYYIRRGRRLRALLFGSLTGLAALFVLNRYGGSFNTWLPLNTINVFGSAVLGVPFVIFLVILKIV